MMEKDFAGFKLASQEVPWIFDQAELVNQRKFVSNFQFRFKI